MLDKSKFSGNSLLLTLGVGSLAFSMAMAFDSRKSTPQSEDVSSDAPPLGDNEEHLEQSDEVDKSSKSSRSGRGSSSKKKRTGSKTSKNSHRHSLPETIHEDDEGSQSSESGSVTITNSNYTGLTSQFLKKYAQDYEAFQKQAEEGEPVEVEDNTYKCDGSAFSLRLHLIQEAHRRARAATPIDEGILATILAEKLIELEEEEGFSKCESESESESGSESDDENDFEPVNIQEDKDATTPQIRMVKNYVEIFSGPESERLTESQRNALADFSNALSNRNN